MLSTSRIIQSFLSVLMIFSLTACFEIVIDSVKLADVTEENINEINIKTSMTLKIITDQNETKICTATLIDPSYLISVAHCFEDGAVYAELLPTVNEKKIVNEIVGIAIQSVFIHPDYDLESGQNDLALIKVDPEHPFIQSLVPMPLSKAKVNTLKDLQVLQIAYQKTQIEMQTEDEMMVMVDALKQTSKISKIISAQDDTFDLIEDVSTKPCQSAGTAIFTFEKLEAKLLGIAHQGNLNCIDAKAQIAENIADFLNKISGQTEIKPQYVYVNEEGNLDVELSCGQLLNCSTRQCSNLKVTADDQPLITALKECLQMNMCASTDFKCGIDLCANQYQACQAN
jgi:hypothetical protein